MIYFRYCLLTGLLFAVVTLAAQPIELHEVPEPLRPWIDWVTFDKPTYGCPFLYNNATKKRCAWPGRLNLELNDDGGRFIARWEVFADSWIVLPGKLAAWPQRVRVDGRMVVVVARGGRPTLHLEPGQHRIEGVFDWDAVPESLTIPSDSGLVRLTINGTKISQPVANRNGQIWLRADKQAAGDEREQDQNKVTLTVLRRIVDDNPLELHTRLELDVTGEQREQIVGSPLPPGFIPTYVQAPLPARLEPDGRLAVQLRPGRHVIVIGARHPAPITVLNKTGQPTPWPSEEIWAFEARNNIRVVEIEGVNAVDARQTRAPKEWHHLPLFTVRDGDAMRLIVTRRGDPDPEPDKLKLVREMWLDFNGGGYTTRDKISGTVTRSWRLDSRSELELGQVLISGKPQFITRVEEEGLEGVELRSGQVDLQADARMRREVDEFAATGWAHDFQSVTATINLPPGWDLFSVRGVDTVPDTWLARWTLLDLFLVLVIAAAVSRLWNWRAAAIAFLTMVIIWHAPGAPRQIWVHLLVAIALLRVVPAGRIQSLITGYRNVTALVLILISVPFVVQQLRLAVYPQLSQPARYYPRAAVELSAVMDADKKEIAGGQAPASMEMEFADEMMLDAPVAADAVTRMKALPRAEATRGARQTADLYRIDPTVIVQTGPGLPDWQWRAMRLGWNGPVDADHRLSIVYITPAANMALHFARVAMLLALLMVVSGVTTRRLMELARRGSMVMTLILATALSTGGEAQAAPFPDGDLLKQLGERLTAPPDCAGQCADIVRMRVDVQPTVLSLRLEVHSAAATAIPLPGNARVWIPEDVRLNDAPSNALSRDPAGNLWLQIPAGVHQLLLTGGLPHRAQVQVSLPLKPHIVEIGRMDGWTLHGLRADGTVEAQLELTRVDTNLASTRQDAFEQTQLPPFVRVERTLRLGLEWSVSTRVVRVVRNDSAVVIAVPLLDGESVVTPRIEVVDGAVQVNMPSRQQSLSWESVLAKRDVISLHAPDILSWAETWRLQAGPTWHVTLDGIAPTHHQGEGDRWIPEWRPWPGESISVSVQKPVGVAGQTITIDSSLLIVKPGKRATESSLELKLRSSKGGQYTLKLPGDAKLQEVRINNVPQPIRAQEGTLTIPITPGAQSVSMAWRDNTGISTVRRTAAIDLAIPSINHRIELILGSDRWTLLTFGPRLGPAVLFWSLLGALLIVALGLSRVHITPLKTHEWLLLVIGLSQLFVPLAAVVVIWLLALGLRERHGASVSGAKFNLVQIGLVILTIAALMVLIEAIRHGLLGDPSMHVAGNASDPHQLRWYADRVDAIPPTAKVISVPLLVYRILMLAWALWLALAIVRWLRWGWSCIASGGLWQPWRKPKSPSQDQVVSPGSAS